MRSRRLTSILPWRLLLRWGVLLLAVLWVGTAALNPRLPQPGSPPTLYANQCRADLRRTLSAAIDRAETQVHLATYTMRSPKIATALRRAAKRGVKVVVHVDAKNAKGLTKQLGNLVTLITHRGKGLMHQKLLVIDGHEVWLGTANMTYASLRSFGNLVVWVDNPELSARLAKTMGQVLSPGQPPYSDTTQQIEYWTLPGNPDALNRLIKLIDKATQRLCVAMFTWTHPALTNAVIRAHRRGVTVQCVVDRSSGRGASRHAVAALHNAGVPIALSIGPELLHHKIAWIDDALIVGSANWTRSAFEKNVDCFLILHHLHSEQRTTLRKLWRAIWVEANLIEC